MNLKDKEYQRAYREKNREHIRATQRAWYAANSERLREEKREEVRKRRATPEGHAASIAESAAYRRAHPDYWKDRYFRKTYGLSLDDVREIARVQGGCAICSTSLVKPKVDHNHDNGQVRQILCNNCNTMLGMAKDAPDILRRGAEYIELWHVIHTPGAENGS